MLATCCKLMRGLTTTNQRGFQPSFPRWPSKKPESESLDKNLDYPFSFLCLLCRKLRAFDIPQRISLLLAVLSLLLLALSSTTYRL